MCQVPAGVRTEADFGRDLFNVLLAFFRALLAVAADEGLEEGRL